MTRILGVAALLLVLLVGARAGVYTLGSPGVSISGTVTVPNRYPDHLTHDFATQGIGAWTANSGGPREVINGVFRSWSWGNDDNHLTSKGGPGRVHLMAYADHYYWRYFNGNNTLVNSDLTNAKISIEVRGINGFALASNQKFIVWVCSDHPAFPAHPASGAKITNWGFIAEPRAITSDWTTVEWVLDPDPAKWVFGGGIGIYDTFLALDQALMNVHNLHFLVLGPDNASAPSGAFEMRNPKITFNRNGPGAGLPAWEFSNKSAAVTLKENSLLAEHAPYTVVGSVRANRKLTGKRYWTTTHVSGDITKGFAYGICAATYVPGLHGTTFFADTVDGWGYMTDRGAKRHGNGSGWDEVAWGPVLSSGAHLMVAYDEATGSLWFGMNGTWFASGDPATGTNPAYTGITGDVYPCESNGTANTSWTFRANFGNTTFAYPAPTGFEGLQ